MKKFIIILGPPGSGKGTQARILAKKTGHTYFGTGDLMRQEAAFNTALGKKFKTAFEKGELVSDKIVQEMVAKELRKIDLSKGIIFDGIPRTIQQAQNLFKNLQALINNLAILNIEVPDAELIQRLSARKTCQICQRIYLPEEYIELKNCAVCRGKLIVRSDDRPAIVQKRIEVYHQQTQPLIDFYRKQNVLIDIDGRPSVPEVAQEIEEKLQDEN